MTVYNRPQYYTEALDSLVNQTEPDFELLVYSNINIDYDISKFLDIKIIHPEVNEMALWLSDAILRAKSDKIVFLDDDDTFIKNKVEYVNNIDFGYFHNDYTHITEGKHNPGKGFNMSCIAINRKYFHELPVALEKNVELGKIPDSFVYWYALENNIPVTITDKKLTNYRFRDYRTLQIRAIDSTKKQNEYLKIADKYFNSAKVKRIIRLRLVSNFILLNSYGQFNKVSFIDLLWLLSQKDVEEKGSKLLSYILTLYPWRNSGIKFIKKFRSKKANLH